MSIFSKIKSLLGFGDDLPEDVIEQDDITDVPTFEPSPSDEAPERPSVQVQKVQQIFTTVVDTFTQALPDFIGKSVDPERMSQQLYDNLDESVKAYLKGLEDVVKMYYQAQWTIERKRLEDDANTLRQKAQELQEKQSSLNDSKVSAERQKRALSTRVNDLEQQVQRLEAEKEQLDLENKCMINKAKAANVLETELEELRASLSANGSQVQPVMTDSQLSEQIAELKAQLEQKDALIAEKDTALSDKDAMIAEQDATIADKTAALADKDALIQERDDALADKIALLAEKEAELKEKDELLAEREGAIAEQDATEREIEEIRQEIEKFEKVKEKMNAKYEKLRRTLEEAQAENESLRNTIRNNLLQSAEDQKKLKDRISELEDGGSDLTGTSVAASTEEEYAANPDKAKVMRKRVPKAKSPDIDDMLDTDWLVSAPATEVSMRSDQSNPDFGYQPPQRPKTKANPTSQPTLFDV